MSIVLCCSTDAAADSKLIYTLSLCVSPHLCFFVVSVLAHPLSDIPHVSSGHGFHAKSWAVDDWFSLTHPRTHKKSGEVHVRFFYEPTPPPPQLCEIKVTVMAAQVQLVTMPIA